MDIRKKQKAIVAALEDIKARDIAAFNVTHLTSLFDRGRPRRSPVTWSSA
jgi:ribosome-associated protein